MCASYRLSQFACYALPSRESIGVLLAWQFSLALNKPSIVNIYGVVAVANDMLLYLNWFLSPSEKYTQSYLYAAK